MSEQAIDYTKHKLHWSIERFKIVAIVTLTLLSGLLTFIFAGTLFDRDGLYFVVTFFGTILVLTLVALLMMLYYRIEQLLRKLEQV